MKEWTSKPLQCINYIIAIPFFKK